MGHWFKVVGFLEYVQRGLARQWYWLKLNSVNGVYRGL